jgi:hypothetical protein
MSLDGLPLTGWLSWLVKTEYWGHLERATPEKEECSQHCYTWMVTFDLVVERNGQLLFWTHDPGESSLVPEECDDQGLQCVEVLYVAAKVTLVYIGYQVSKKNSSASPSPRSTDPHG